MKYLDLLAKPWSEMNCGHVVVEGLHRMGLHDAALYVPVDQEAAAFMVNRMADGIRACSWFMVASPDMKHYAEPGDVIVSDGASGSDAEYHVALVIDGGMALTSSRRHGVHCIRVQRTVGVRGVYRWNPGGVR